MNRYFAIAAPRNIRALYYAAEYGVRGAWRLLQAESDRQQVVRTCGGTAVRCCGLYKTRREAERAKDRLLVMAATLAGKLGRDLAWYGTVETVRADASAFETVKHVRPLAS